MKRILSLVLALALTLGLAACGGQPASETPDDSSVPASQPAPQEEYQARVGGLKGPTTLGMLKLIQDANAGAAQGDWQTQMFGSPSEVLPLITKGELDLAAVPVNLAATLYNRTEGQIQVAAVNTLGVLYLVSTDDSVHTVEDLRGRTIYSSGKGTTPEYVLRALLEQNGLDPEQDVTLEFLSESTEVLATLQASSAPAVALLPQPFVTAAQMKVEGLQVALDLTEEWNKVFQVPLLTGVLVVRREFAQQHPETVQAYLAEYEASIEYVNTHVEEAAQWAEEAGVVAKAPIAQKAIPHCNLAYMDGQEMKTIVASYLDVMFQQDAQSVGGAMPQDDFYYGA